MTARYSIPLKGARDTPSACGPFSERLPPFPRVAGGQHKLDDLATDGSDAKNFASEEPSLRLGTVVCFEALNFFE
jgi:hypothetical protein